MIVEIVPSRLVIVATPTCKNSRSRKVAIPVFISISLIVAIPETNRSSVNNCGMNWVPATYRSLPTYKSPPNVPNPVKVVTPLTRRSRFNKSTNSSPKVTPLI